MLRCSVTQSSHPNDPKFVELCQIEIENTGGTTYEGDYVVRFVTSRGAAIGIHSRTIHQFPRRKYNALALLLQALSTLSEEELSLEGDTGHMARQERGTLPEIQTGES